MAPAPPFEEIGRRSPRSGKSLYIDLTLTCLIGAVGNPQAERDE